MFLRNSWYLENYTSQLQTYLERGIVGAAGDGKVSAATRADFAEAAAAVLTTGGAHQPGVRTGWRGVHDDGARRRDIAADWKQVTYTDLPVDKYIEFLAAAGTPQP